jgi:hypothetical protein
LSAARLAAISPRSARYSIASAPLLDRQHRADARAQPQPLQAGSGEDDGVVIAAVQFGKPGVEIAAQARHHKLRIAAAKLCLAPQAGSADHRSRGQCIQSVEFVGDEGIARVLALQDRGQGEACGQIHRHVLGRVHGQIGAALGQRQFQFFHEQALAADFGERSIQDFVPARGQGEEFDPAIRI